MKLPKSARLHHRSLQEGLFAEGHNINEYPIRLIWRALTAEELKRNFRDHVPDLIGPLQVLVSVPKKKRRRAVDRVRTRRLMREAWRLRRGPLLDKIAGMPDVRTVSVGLVYRKDGNSDFCEISAKMERLIVKLISRLDAEEKQGCED